LLGYAVVLPLRSADLICSLYEYVLTRELLSKVNVAALVSGVLRSTREHIPLEILQTVVDTEEDFI
jgi:hypothetical protein